MTIDQRSQMASIPKLPRLQIPDSTSLRSRSTQNLPTPSPTASDRLLTDAKQRLGHRDTMEITHHPLFDEVDWRMLANCKAPILDYLRMLSYSCISEVAPEGLGVMGMCQTAYCVCLCLWPPSILLARRHHLLSSISIPLPFSHSSRTFRC